MTTTYRKARGLQGARINFSRFVRQKAGRPPKSWASLGRCSGRTVDVGSNSAALSSTQAHRDPLPISTCTATTPSTWSLPTTSRFGSGTTPRIVGWA